MKYSIGSILILATLLAVHTGARAQETNNYHTFDGGGQETIGTNWKGHVYTITLLNDKTTALCVDSKKIAAADLVKYDSLVNRIVTQVRRDEAQGEIDRAQGERDHRQGELDRQQGERDRQQAELDRQQAARDQQQAERDRQQADDDGQQAARDREQAVRDREQAAHDRDQAVRDREQADRDRQQAELDRRQAAEDRENMRRLIQLLVDKKLVPDAAGLKSLLLTEDELIVNGKKASPEIQKEIKEKYSRWARLGLSYGACCDCCTSVHFHNNPG
jgi:hypothetical protein